MKNDFSGVSGVSKEFKEQVNEQKQWLEERRQIILLREDKNNKIQEKIKEKEKLLKSCHPIYNKKETLERGV